MYSCYHVHNSTARAYINSCGQFIHSSRTTLAIVCPQTIYCIIIWSGCARLPQAVAALVLFLAFLVGFSGFQSNAVQFSLDQLLDSSSEELSLFLHWFVWTGYAGELIIRLLSSASACSTTGEHVITGYMSLPFLALSTVCLILIFHKRRW